MEQNNVSLEPVMKELENLFSILNGHFYNNGLIQPIITIMPRGRRNCSGWCSNKYLWKKAKNNESKENVGYYEINICAEYISLDFEDMVELMLHEMAHLYNSQHGIEDTSRSGTYHNKEYKSTAERHGLFVTKHPSCGWATTSLNSIATDFLQTLTPFKFNIARIDLHPTRKAKKSMRKLVCPICGCSARVTSSKTKLKCGTCDTYLLDECDHNNNL